MDTTAIITKVKQSPQMTELFARICDFELIEPDAVDLGVRLQSERHLNVIAQDASGGVFALCEASNRGRHPVLYVSSEGQAGIIARDLVAALQLMIQLPYWRDCLKFSGGGQLDEMDKAISYLERELRAALLSTMEFAHPLVTVETLYHAVISTAETCGVISLHGNVLRSLFNTFVVSDNPLWQNIRTAPD